jgi:retinol dehydrogenase 12
MTTMKNYNIQAINPGNLETDLYRTVDDQRGFQRFGLQTFTRWMLYPTINGAYTELFAGLSDEVTMDRTGAWSKFLAHDSKCSPPGGGWGGLE